MNVSTSTSRRPFDRAYSLDTAIDNSKPKWRPPTLKTVRFQTNPEIIGRSLIPDAAATIWYTSSELHTIREDVRNTVRQLKKAGGNPLALDNEHCCARGVENVQKSGGMSDMRRRTRNMIQGLLDEQNYQRKMGIYDPKGLQVRARVFSKAAREKALLLAKQDEMEALEISPEASDIVVDSAPQLWSASFESKDDSVEDSKIECGGRCAPNLAFQHQHKKSSSARSA